MEIYIEQVIIDNLVINHILLFLTSKFLFLKVKHLQFFLSSFVGMIFCFVFPFLNLSVYLLFALKILVGLLMIQIAFNEKKLKKIFLNFIVFFCLTIILGGLVLVVILNLFPSATLSNGTLVYDGFLPIGIFALFVTIFFKLIFDSFKAIKKRGVNAKFEYKVKLSHLDKEIFLQGFLDSGNLLVDKQSLKPISIICFSAFKKLLNLSNQDFLLGKYKLNNSRLVYVDTIISKDKILVFEADLKIDVEGKIKIKQNALIGLSCRNFKNFFNCEVLLNSQILE